MVKKAIKPADIPKYFSAWVEKSSPLCIYTPEQVNTFKASHLNGGGWYIDCSPKFCPSSEEEEMAALGAIDIPIVGAMKDYSPVMEVASKTNATQTSKRKKVLKKADESIVNPTAPLPNSSIATEDSTEKRPIIDLSMVDPKLVTSLARESKKRERPNLSSASNSIQVFVENVSIQSLLNEFEETSKHNIIWTKAHEFIEKVCFASIHSHSLHFISLFILSLSYNIL